MSQLIKLGEQSRLRVNQRPREMSTDVDRGNRGEAE